MRKPTPGHSPEYRQWAVEKAIASGNISQTSRELRLARSVLMRWCKAYRQHGGTGLKQGPGRPRGRKVSPHAEGMLGVGGEHELPFPQTVADITYIRCREAFLFLSKLFDAAAQGRYSAR